MSLVLFEIRDNIALLTLNNPDKRNMLTLEVCEMIVDYVESSREASRSESTNSYWKRAYFLRGRST